eukprot:38608-Chlamydomonas_euryale.AAC.1
MHAWGGPVRNVVSVACISERKGAFKTRGDACAVHAGAASMQGHAEEMLPAVSTNGWPSKTTWRACMVTPAWPPATMWVGMVHALM